MRIIIICLLVYNYYKFLLYTRVHSSPAEHENLSLKFELEGNSPTSRKMFFKDMKNKISNKCYCHLPKL